MEGEKYVLVVPCGVRAVEDWDATWTAEYDNALKTLSWGGAIALTCEPEEIRTTAGGTGEKPVVEDGIGAVAQNFIRGLNETSKAAIVAKPRSTFPVVGRMNGRFPEVSTRLFPQKNSDAVQSVILGSCMMTTARTLKPALRAATMDCPPYASNFVLSALLYTHSRASFVAAEPVFVRAAKPNNMRPAHWDSRALQREMLEVYGEYAEFCGVDLEESLVLGQGNMGVLPDLESHDILSKYGTRREFERVKQQFQ